MKKKFVIGFAFVLFMSFAIVSAVDCEDDQTIMRLHSVSNSHVSFWNENAVSYTEEICYDDIFGSVYIGTGSHDCTGSNGVLWLHSLGNSHAAIATGGDYNNEVCYGDLRCDSDSSAGSGCINGGRIVARIESEYNSHVSYASDTNFGVKICCGVFYWADMNGNEITEANEGDSVQMIMTSTNGDVYDFEVWDDDAFVDDKIRTIEGGNEIAGVISGGDVVGIWTVTRGDLDAADDALENFEGFYFKVNGKESKKLKIIEGLGYGSDTPMKITVLSPGCGSYFNESDSVMVDIVVDDPDDVVHGNISIDGSVKESFNNVGGGNTINFIETFESFGSFQVVIDAVDEEGKRTRAISNIMVLEKDAGGNYVDGEYIAACIAEPKDFSNIDGTDVRFDASTTRAIKVVDGTLIELVPGEDSFSWYWKFSPEGKTRYVINSSDSDAYKFNKRFPTVGRNSAILRVEIG